MIDPDAQPGFPNNVVKCLQIVLPGIDEDVVVFPRPLKPTDPNFSVGVYGALWTPNQDSNEIGHIAPGEPTLGTYRLGIQTVTKDGDSERGLATSSILANRIRTVLYRNQPLRVALGSLQVQDGDFKESLRRWGISNQQYMSNELDGTFVTVSVLDLWIETEMS